MNPVPLAAWIQSSHLPVIGFCGAALTLGVVLAIAYRNSGGPETDLDDEPTQRTAWAVARAVLGGVAAVTTFVLLFWQGPWWFDEAHIRDKELEPADGVVITGFRTGLVALAAGVIAGVGLYYTHRKHKLEHKQFQHVQDQFAETDAQFRTTLEETRKRDERQAELTREGQVTALYVEAIKLLASDQQYEALGGIYSLERIMRDSAKDRTTVVEVLAAYARTRLDGTAAELRDASAETALPTGASEPQLLTLPETIRATLNVLGRNWREEAHRRPDLRNMVLEGWDASEVDLTGAWMTGADLKNGHLPRARLRHAILRSTNLDGARLNRVQADGADFTHADLHRTDLRDARLNTAVLRETLLYQTKLQRAKLFQADLREANLEEANLSNANLTEAQLQGANLINTVFTDANLYDADLSGTDNLRAEQLCQARIYRSSTIPEGLLAHPHIKARIEECEEAYREGEPPPAWDPTRVRP
ncbi:pentapeptide repeat-containing protein [Streptomyces sp. UC4497]